MMASRFYSLDTIISITIYNINHIINYFLCKQLRNLGNDSVPAGDQGLDNGADPIGKPCLKNCKSAR